MKRLTTILGSIALVIVGMAIPVLAQAKKPNILVIWEMTPAITTSAPTTLESWLSHTQHRSPCEGRCSVHRPPTPSRAARRDVPRSSSDNIRSGLIFSQLAFLARHTAFGTGRRPLAIF